LEIKEPGKAKQSKRGWFWKKTRERTDPRGRINVGQRGAGSGNKKWAPKCAANGRSKERQSGVQNAKAVCREERIFAGGKGRKRQ